MCTSYLACATTLRRFRVLGVAFCAAIFASLTWAQTTQDAELQDLALRWLRDAALAARPQEATPLRLEVSVGALDGRLKLAVCGNVEPYLPPGSRLWGRTRVGLRCVDGLSRWNVTIAGTVRAFGTAWVVKGYVPSGTVVTEADVMESIVDWAEETSPVIKDKGQWVGQIATRVLATGQTLRQGMVKAAQVFQAGASVRVVALGQGFQISADAQALSAGVIGQPARVKMENGRITSGTVLNERTVRIDL